MASYSKTRWWSKWEVMSQVMTFFGDILPFLKENPELSSATNQKLVTMLENPSAKPLIQIELAAVIDAGKPFVKATYNLEADGVMCFETLSALAASIHVAHYPNVLAVANSLGGAVAANTQKWVDYAKTCVQPGLQYFLDKFTHEFSGSVAAFKAARFFLPQKVVELKPDAEAIDSVRAFPFLAKPSVLGGLKSELPNYLAKAMDMDPDTNALQWWRAHKGDLPTGLLLLLLKFY